MLKAKVLVTLSLLSLSGAFSCATCFNVAMALLNSFDMLETNPVFSITLSNGTNMCGNAARGAYHQLLARRADIVFGRYQSVLRLN